MDERIASVHEADIAKARRIVRGAITEAGEEWLSSAVIIDALLLEMIDVAGRYTSPDQIAAHLNDVAARLRREQTRAH